MKLKIKGNIFDTLVLNGLELDEKFPELEFKNYQSELEVSGPEFFINNLIYYINGYLKGKKIKYNIIK